MQHFAHAVRSETTKLLSLRSTFIYAILLTGSLYGPVFLIGLFSTSTYTVHWGNAVEASFIFTILTAAFAANLTGGSLSHKLHAQVFLTQPSRNLWISAQLLVSIAFITVCWFVGIAVCFLEGLVMPKMVVGNAEFKVMLAHGALVLVTAFVAHGITVLTRSRIFGVIIPAAWMFIIEQLLAVAAPLVSVAGWAVLIGPVARAMQLSGMSYYDPEVSWAYDHTQPTWFNVLVMVAWGVLGIAMALVFNRRRDVR